MIDSSDEKRLEESHSAFGKANLFLSALNHSCFKSGHYPKEPMEFFRGHFWDHLSIWTL